MTSQSSLRPDLLTTRQLITVILLGIAAWFLAALGARFTAAAGWMGPSTSWVSFFLAIPGCWLLVFFMQKAAALQPIQLVGGLALGTAAAAFCDAIAFNAFPSLYSSNPDQALRCAAWILWGAAWGLVFAYLRATPDTANQ